MTEVYQDDGDLFVYRAASSVGDRPCTVCGETVKVEDLDDPDALTSNPAYVHWGCL